MADDASGRLVVDASVAAKLFFDEAGSDEARRVLKGADTLLAPDLLFIEMASLALKRVRRGLSTIDRATNCVVSVPTLIDQVTPMAAISERALHIAADSGLSAYDGAYVALAEAEGAILVTADIKLARLANAAGLGHHVMALAEP